MDLLLINGASGSGKTTLAKVVSEILQDSSWVHPDSLLPDTPHMTAEEILDKSLSWAEGNVQEHRVVVDCQIRPTALDRVLQPHSIDSREVILLDCPKMIREQRLLDRGWSSGDFERVENWANILRGESQQAGMLIFDTSVDSVESICGKVVERLRSDA